MRPGSFPLAYGMTCPDSMSLILDMCNVGPSLPLRSFAHTGSALWWVQACRQAFGSMPEAGVLQFMPSATKAEKAAQESFLKASLRTAEELAR